MNERYDLNLDKTELRFIIKLFDFYNKNHKIIEESEEEESFRDVLFMMDSILIEIEEIEKKEIEKKNIEIKMIEESLNHYIYSSIFDDIKKEYKDIFIDLHQDYLLESDNINIDLKSEEY